MTTAARRRFLAGAASLAVAAAGSRAPVAFATTTPAPRERRLLVLVELKGGNDGLNTLVPFADATYYALRPRIAIARVDAVPLADDAGFHPSLAPLLPMWEAGSLALLRGVGYPSPNLSHFRSIEIWDTAAPSDEHFEEGWLSRSFAAAPRPRGFVADGVIVGSGELGPLAGRGVRAIALADTGSFQRRARLAADGAVAGNRALEHIGRVESDIRNAASRLVGGHAFRTAFPPGAFGAAIRTASEVIANPAGVAVVRVTLDGFDTHANQPGTHARLLSELAHGLVALESALKELRRYDDTLVLTYSEFGRRPRENFTAGTDHGTSSVHLAFGGGVRGGMYGAMPDLAKLDGGGNPAHAIDFRSVYATVLERWWEIEAKAALRGRFEAIPFLAA